MKKNWIVFAMIAVMLFSLVGCGENGGGKSTADGGSPKIGVILVGDENEGYTYAHIEGIKKAAANTGIPEENLLW